MSRYNGERFGSTLDRFDFVGLPPATVDAVVVLDEAPGVADNEPLVTGIVKADVTVVFVANVECVGPLINGVKPI